MKGKIRIISSIVFGIIVVALIVLVIMLGIGRANNKAVFVFGRAAVWIVSPSMEPTIMTNTYVLIREADASEVAVGDVIMFYSDDPQLNGNFNTHRVMEIVGDNEEFVTKGDNNTPNDKYTAKAEKVVGIYEKPLPLITAAMRFFMTSTGLGIVIVLIVGVSCASCIPDIIRYARKKKEESLDEQTKQKLIEEEIERLKNDKTQTSEANSEHDHEETNNNQENM